MSRRLRSWSTEWVDALQDARPELDEPAARLLVNGAIGMITSIATGPTTEVDGLADSITSMALSTLDAPVD